jgi:hypothetical protein
LQGCKRRQCRDREHNSEQKNGAISDIIGANPHHSCGHCVADRGIACVAAEPFTERPLIDRGDGSAVWIGSLLHQGQK